MHFKIQTGVWNCQILNQVVESQLLTSLWNNVPPMTFWHWAQSDKDLFPAFRSRIIPCFTAGKRIGVWNCHATRGHRKAVICTSRVCGWRPSQELNDSFLRFVYFSTFDFTWWIHPLVRLIFWMVMEFMDIQQTTSFLSMIANILKNVLDLWRSTRSKRGHSMSRRSRSLSTDDGSHGERANTEHEFSGCVVRSFSA